MHVQTQQKLEVMLRYWEVWCLIIAQAMGHSFCVHCMWLVDGFAGAGLHATNGHPDGAVAGTPVQAFRAAVNTKRRYPSVDVHLRAVDVNGTYAQELERRLLRAPGAAAEKPNWRVYPSSFQKAYPKILEEMRADLGHTHSSGPTYRLHNHRSLWLVDPFGVKDIPHADLEPLEKLPGAEVIINLDLGGLIRVKGAAEKALDEGDPDAFQAAIKAGNAKPSGSHVGQRSVTRRPRPRRPRRPTAVACPELRRHVPGLPVSERLSASRKPQPEAIPGASDACRSCGNPVQRNL